MIIFSSSNRFYYLLIALVLLIAYANSFQNSFHFDDYHVIVSNPAIKNPANIKQFFFDPQLGSSIFKETSGYRPLLMISFALNYLIGGLDTFGFHILNFLIHILCAILVFSITFFFFQITYNVKELNQNRYKWVALSAALIFSLHPIQVESVTYITGRSSSLTALFFLISFWTYLQFSISGKVYNLLTSIFTFALALLVKESAVTLILILILFNILFPLSRTLNSRIYTLSPYLFIMALYISLRLYLFDTLMYSSQPLRPFYDNILTQFKAWVHALGILILPLNLNVDYDIPISHSILESEVLFSIFILISIILLIWTVSKYCRPIGFFALWFAVNLAPTSSVIPLEDIITDRWLYLPSVGFAIIVTFGLEWIYMKKIYLRPRAVRWFFLFLTALLIEFYAFQTVLRNFTWRSYWTLWEDAVEKSPNKARPHIALGLALNAVGLTEEAMQEFKKAITISRHAGEAYLNIGHIYFIKGKYEEAIPFFHKAMQLRPRLAPVAHNNLGALYFNIGKTEKAFKELQEALRIRPFYARPHYNFGLYYLNKGDLDKAIFHLQKAIEFEPEFLPGHNLLIVAYEKKGLKEKSQEAYRNYLRYEKIGKAYMAGE